MAGYTDAVVLEAPVFWWPSLEELTKYPIDPHRSFLAAVTDDAMPWACVVYGEVDNARLIRTVGLSRLGRSVWTTAEWSPLEDGDAQPFVKVWSPISAEVLHLPVCTSVGRGSSVATFEELLKLDVPQLARDGRIRLTHRILPTDLWSRSTSATRLFERLHRRAQQHLAYPLLHRVLTRVYTSTVNHLRRVLHTAASSPASSSVATGSLLFTCDTPSQKHLIDLLQWSTPSFLPLGQAHVAAVSLEVRRLNFAEVLTLNEHEALETIEVALRPPPLHSASSSASIRSFLPCLLITLESLQLLEAHANSLVAGVTHQLCLCLEALREGPVPALVWSFAEDVSAIPAALLSRVGAQHVRLSATAAEDRATYWQKRVEVLHQHADVNAATSSPSASPVVPITNAVVAALTEETAHWTVDRLVQLRDAEILKLCASHVAATSPPPPPSTQEAPPTLASWHKDDADTPRREPLHAVYSHLYGIDDDIRKVEELVVWPLTHLSLLRALSIPCPKGVLVCGASGSGKTALLSSLARRLQLPETRSIHVASVDGLALIEKEVGRSEKNIAQLFEAARALAPTALFIDNLDALAPPRGRTTAETNTTGDRTLSTLLTQMDGVSGQADRVVVVVASAPSLSALDPAVCRPGRLDVHVHLRPPAIDASAAFMKLRLQQFLAHAQSRFGSLEKDGTEGGVATEFVGELVNSFFAAVTADAAHRRSENDKEARADAAVAAMSPAEVSAVVREVVLHVAEHLDQDTSCNGERKKRKASLSEIQQCMADAFARRGTAT
ncbi:cell division cycle protein-like protein [Leptomonas pyrrhocoris]|uniref:Cell division cycle protein-like protein n=1 Tax=Leptomonas pyrrhocoris TaxID=157538 RepID=A0A0N0VDG2_LEPPY|nr:cell division cycle protein-like protein [Leptomonas pyrrhocoris]KPA75208.1 cell division cycle protein-like protein [Leptomonas pyrrhocoris]|eukprot:XP_015653647.1 cell division cycle protein-like protein [Leptomonas pyrrhocoris]